ncbi:MAG: hypothetical protein Q9191_002571 [Dirinaria sp. TL-2023a]
MYDDDTSVAVLEKPIKSEAVNKGGDHANGNLGLNSASSSEHDENEHWTPEDRAAHRSQAILHFHKKITANNSKYQGIHPMIALDSHQVNLANLVQEALQSLPPFIPNHHDTALPRGSISVYEPSGQRLKGKRKPDFVSVTRGPGMRASLSTGLDTAKGLAVAWQVPLVGVHHMQAHSLTPRLVSALKRDTIAKSADEDSTKSGYEPMFPYLSLLISGGHTLVVHTASLTSHTILATTIDIAVGDCLDKCAREILPSTVLAASTETMYGRLLEHFVFPSSVPKYAYIPPRCRAEEFARKPTQWGWALTPPLAVTTSQKSKNKGMQFSFTSVGSTVKCIVEDRIKASGMAPDERRALGRHVMEVVFEHLASRAVTALQALQKSEETEPEHHTRVRTLVVSGGVASNGFLRHILRSYLDCRGFAHVELLFPPIELCTDNAAMIGWAAMEMYEAGWESELAIQAVRKWSLDANDAEDGAGAGILGLGGWKKNHRLVRL